MKSGWEKKCDRKNKERKNKRKRGENEGKKRVWGVNKILTYRYQGRGKISFFGGGGIPGFLVKLGPAKHCVHLRFYRSSPFRHIWVHEGPRGLFRGLGPNLVGVAPSRAIYFWSYSTTKKGLNRRLPKSNRDTPFVHVVSAASAGTGIYF
jgi:hypothetical protein